MTGSITDLQAKTANVSLGLGAEISHVDITERIPEQWGEIIEAEADKERIFRGLCRVFTDLVGKAGDTLKIPKRAILNYDLYGPTELAELTAIAPNVELTYRTIPVTPIEVGIGARITKQAIAEAMVSLIDDALSEMGRAVAQKEDLDIVTAATVTTVGEEVYFIEANQTGAPYVSGLWTVAQAGAKTLNVWQVAQTNLIANDVLDLGVISQAKNVIMAKNGFRADAIIIHPEQQAELMNNEQFLEASKAGDSRMFRNGEIGSIFGLSVFMSMNLPKLKCAADGLTAGYQAILIDSKAALALVIKRPVTIESKYEPGERMHYIFITSMYKAKRVNDGGIVVVNTT
jgi:N4-gp56 family major capsid protein